MLPHYMCVLVCVVRLCGVWCEEEEDVASPLELCNETLKYSDDRVTAGNGAITLLYTTLQYITLNYNATDNSTRNGGEGGGVDNTDKGDLGKSVYCWLRLVGDANQAVEVFVRKMQGGEWNEYTHGCEGGYLRISDSETCSAAPWWLPPTTVCGQHMEDRLKVKRITRSTTALLEFKVDNATIGDGYELDVAFIDVDVTNSLPYGHLKRTDGHIQNTACDWLIPVDACFAYCHVISPGFPGIYAPLTRCRYLFTNFDDERIELLLQPRGYEGKFDMKMTPRCTEDYVDVYDGSSTLSQLIGRFCGHVAHNIVSTGSSLLLIMQSGVGGPPWDYSGFNARATGRWRNEHRGGARLSHATYSCDWRFSSANSKRGDLHFPDHFLPPGTVCRYEFITPADQQLHLDIAVGSLRRNCEDSIEVVTNNRTALRVCSSDVDRKQTTLHYNTTDKHTLVLYTSSAGQMSALEPVYIDYQYKPAAAAHETSPPLDPVLVNDVMSRSKSIPTGVEVVSDVKPEESRSQQQTEASHNGSQNGSHNGSPITTATTMMNTATCVMAAALLSQAILST